MLIMKNKRAKEMIQKFLECAIAHFKEEKEHGENEIYYKGIYEGAKAMLVLSKILKEGDIEVLINSARKEAENL